jgi:gliding-associated putative ABC transporter substrate-binding component GldG
MKAKNSIINYLAMVCIIVILINILAYRFFFRLDFTQDNQYTLSRATKNMLSTLDDPITVTAYFSEDLPPAIGQTKTEFKDILVEYASRSKGNVLYEFVNPNKDQTSETEAVKAGISSVMINVREKDQTVQKKAYLGAVVKFEGKGEVIPFIRPGESMEYVLSAAMKKLITKNKPTVGFIQGNGEPSLSSFPQALTNLKVLYNVESVNLTDTTGLTKYKTLCMIAPTDSFSDKKLKILDKYLFNQGNLYIAINRVNGDLSKAMGTEVKSGLEKWLAQTGVKIDPAFVIDSRCANVSVRQQQGAFTFDTQIPFPYLPIISTFAKHPITKGLESVVLQFASPISFTGDTSKVKFLPLAFTSEKSGAENSPLYFNIQKKWGESDFTRPKLTVAAILDGKISGDKKSKIVVISDGDFAVNGEGQQVRQLQPDNLNLMVNSIDWLSDDTGLIELRTKSVTSRPIKQMEDGAKISLKYLNFLLPIILIIIYGIFRVQRNRMIRVKRMNENYV